MNYICIYVVTLIMSINDKQKINNLKQERRYKLQNQSSDTFSKKLTPIIIVETIMNIN